MHGSEQSPTAAHPLSLLGDTRIQSQEARARPRPPPAPPMSQHCPPTSQALGGTQKSESVISGGRNPSEKPRVTDNAHPRFSSIYKGRPRGPSTKSTVDRPQGTMGLSLHTRPDSRPRAAEWRRVKRDSMSPHALPTPSPACSKPQTHRDRGPGSTAWAERR